MGVYNCTVSDNAAATGGGLYNFNFNGTANVILSNTILKTGSSGANLVNSGGTIQSNGHNLSSDNGGGFLTATGDQINTNPNLGGLAQNGGPTQTHALLTGSPAINAGDDAFAPKLDQRGYLRVGVSDIGAFEFGGSPLRITSIVRLTNGHIVLQGIGVPNGAHTLQILPDLGSGTPTSVPLSANGTGSIQYDDTNAVGLTKRFYRLAYP
jgi:hypothetical protein